MSRTTGADAKRLQVVDQPDRVGPDAEVDGVADRARAPVDQAGHAHAHRGEAVRAQAGGARQLPQHLAGGLQQPVPAAGAGRPAHGGDHGSGPGDDGDGQRLGAADVEAGHDR